MEELEAQLHVEAELALETLRGAVDEYAGPIMDERTRTKLVRKRCVKPFDKRKADADDYIERVRSMVEPQRAEWRRKCECLVRFASRAARVRDARRHEAECDGGGDRGEQYGGRGGEALGQVVRVLEHGGDAEPDGRIVKDDQAA